LEDRVSFVMEDIVLFNKLIMKYENPNIVRFCFPVFHCDLEAAAVRGAETLPFRLQPVLVNNLYELANTTE